MCYKGSDLGTGVGIGHDMSENFNGWPTLTWRKYLAMINLANSLVMFHNLKCRCKWYVQGLDHCRLAYWYWVTDVPVTPTDNRISQFQSLVKQLWELCVREEMFHKCWITVSNTSGHSVLYCYLNLGFMFTLAQIWRLPYTNNNGSDHSLVLYHLVIPNLHSQILKDHSISELVLYSKCHALTPLLTLTALLRFPPEIFNV